MAIHKTKDKSSGEKKHRIDVFLLHEFLLLWVSLHLQHGKTDESICHFEYPWGKLGKVWKPSRQQKVSENLSTKDA